MPDRISLESVNFVYPGRRRLTLGGGRPRINSLQEHTVLRGLSLKVAPGTVAAVIGRNGCGKSTLVKLIAGILEPTSGKSIVEGRIAALIELGAGFDPELSVNDNVLLYGALLGNRVREVKGAVDEILGWADLSHVKWAPVRTLSSGMMARLGFSVATQFQPDVLLIDEVLSVGDVDFQKRSRQRIGRILESGCSVLLVTHDMIAARELADKCYWLNEGKVHLQGDPVKVTTAYMESLTNSSGDL